MNEQAQELYDEAKRLELEQIKERGTAPGPVIEGKPTKVRGPYEATTERENRAARILALRREAARLEYPLRVG